MRQPKVKFQYFLTSAALLFAALLFRLPYEFHRLLFSSSELAAIDLRQRYDEVQAWFAGENVYSILNSAVYPPASYLMMWPFMGFSSWQLVKWIWAISSIIFLAVIIKFLLKENSINRPREKILWSLFILAHYATGINIGNGQFTIHVMAAILGIVAFLKSGQSGWRNAWLAGILASFSLVKPTVALPFMWLVLLVPRNIYPALATAFTYTLLALVASSFQSYGVFQLHRDWLSLGIEGAAWSSNSSNFSNSNSFLGGDVGYGDVHTLLSIFGMSDWAFFISLGLLALLGIWIYFYRRCHIWVLLGITAVFSRIWTYHRVYDDMLIIFAIFAVIAAIKLELNPQFQQIGNLLLAFLIIASLVPASLRLLPAPLDLVFKVSQPTLWIITLLYLGYAAHMEKHIKSLNAGFSSTL